MPQSAASGQRLAIIGTGISGLLSAHLLARRNQVTVFEAADRLGGHTNTVDVQLGGASWAVDTGFIVFNTLNYPLFTGLLDELGVESRPSDMSFSFQSARTGIEWKGTDLNSIFAQRRNALRPSFLRMLKDIVRFNRDAPRELADESDALPLGAYLKRGGYSRTFIDSYIIPMGAAVWSAVPSTMLEFPARYFVQFFSNHRFLQLKGRPLWRVVQGGSSTYLAPLIAPIKDRIRTGSPVRSVARTHRGVEVCVDGQPTQTFDAAVIATHSDQALRMLADTSRAEREVLGAIPYQPNDVGLQTHEGVMPRTRRAWAAWNYHAPDRDDRPATVTYHMNQLQGLPGPTQYFVTLNRTAEIDPRKVLRQMTYHHPIYTPATRAAQNRHAEINGANRTWYCGAYWGYGFHEDGVSSAQSVVQSIDRGGLVA